MINRVLIHNIATDEMETFMLDDFDPMPYTLGKSMPVYVFRGVSESTTLWSDTMTLSAWNITRHNWSTEIDIDAGFSRVWEGGYGFESPHYAGIGFEVGLKLSGPDLEELHDITEDLHVWNHVEPFDCDDEWIDFDRLSESPACSDEEEGYPRTERGSIGTYVLVLQDALNTLGYSTRTLDGIFGANTESAVRSFQSANGLGVDGIVGCQTWRKLLGLAVGVGRSSTTID